MRWIHAYTKERKFENVLKKKMANTEHSKQPISITLTEYKFFESKCHSLGYLLKVHWKLFNLLIIEKSIYY